MWFIDGSQLLFDCYHIAGSCLEQANTDDSVKIKV
jgi:hypothetical protein